MKKLMGLMVVAAWTSAGHAAPAVVEDVAERLKLQDVKKVITEVYNTDGNPCLPEGLSYQMEIQVKTVVGYEPDLEEIIYKWQTVKMVNIDKDGNVMEICRE